ncbi:uncharacterized protein LOC132260840 [Phlebotomus argentipes]|uniref:uncharacterized protein LOC132260840 n=1 Tax=Phlebotomus argentipes TaxID=94469 RepID=UPI0028934DBA|nr:uncharacterized protein LOC132260840 [Phlebotomus argentipes]
MSGICCVSTCRRRLERNRKNVKSFPFPNDSKRRKIWIAAVQNVQKNWTFSTFNRICNEHFKSSDFYANEKTKEITLKTTAVPSIFLKDASVVVKSISTRLNPFPSIPIKSENDVNYNDDDNMIENPEDVNTTVIEEYLIEEDPLTGNAEFKYSASTSKFYGQEEASDSDDGEVIEMLQSPDDSLTSKLSKLISEENMSNACAAKLLRILKQHGHAELPKKSEELVEAQDPENEEIEHMNKVLDYVTAEARDIEAKMQFKLNFLSKCLNRIECKVQAMTSQPIDSGPSTDLYATAYMNLFPIENIDKLMQVEEKIGEDEDLEVKIRSLIHSHPRSWLKHMFADDLMDEFTLNGSGNKGNFMELKIINCIEKYVSRGDILHQKRQSKDRFNKTKSRQKKKDKDALQTAEDGQ